MNPKIITGIVAMVPRAAWGPYRWPCVVLKYLDIRIGKVITLVEVSRKAMRNSLQFRIKMNSDVAAMPPLASGIVTLIIA